MNTLQKSLKGMIPFLQKGTILGLSTLIGCNGLLPTSDSLDCYQIEVTPAESQLLGDGISTTEVDLSVCACSSENTCTDANLISGVSLELESDMGSLSEEVLYLPTGQGSVTWTSPHVLLCDSGSNCTEDAQNQYVTPPQEQVRGEISATFLQSLTQSGSVLFGLPDRYPESFELSSETTELLADGKSTLLLTLSAAGLEDGTMVSVESSGIEGASILPANQPIRNESATFVYKAPELDADATAQEILLGKIDALSYYSTPLIVSLNGPSEDTDTGDTEPETDGLKLSPEQGYIVMGSVLTLVATGGDGDFNWASPSAQTLNCNGTPGFEACESESKAVLSLASDPCAVEDEETEEGEPSDSGTGSDTGEASTESTSMTAEVRCSILVWVSDGSGQQAQATVDIY